jgi:hypothetical protein
MAWPPAGACNLKNRAQDMPAIAPGGKRGADADGNGGQAGDGGAGLEPFGAPPLHDHQARAAEKADRGGQNAMKHQVDIELAVRGARL